MANKKAIISVCIVLLLVAAAAAVYFIYSSSGYSAYSGAFKKTFNTDSMELNTSVKAVVDGATVSSTGNFKLKGMNTTPQFLNVMTVGGQTVTQFSDGVYIYTDDGQSKNKMEMGATPDPHREKENAQFSMDSYLSEFSSLLDASKIKELNSLEPVAERYVEKISVSNVSGGKRFEVTLLPAAIDELVGTFISEKLSNELSPEVAWKSVVYTATVSNGYVSEIAFKLNLDVTPPNETVLRDVTVDFIISPVNPGRPVAFDLPDTSGF
ncbi:MAG: hypothetical protein FWG94_04870 [Oscillospiraceae bacterium]|nr:hypothetical protein [Oscillospiraceae bacterium]